MRGPLFPALAPAALAALLLPAAARALEPAKPAPSPYRYAHEGLPARSFGMDREYDLLHQALDLTLDMKARSVEGTSYLLLSPLRPVESLSLHAGEMALRACRVTDAPSARPDGLGSLLRGPAAEALASAAAGAAAGWDLAGDTLRVRLPRPAGPGDTLLLAVEYAARPRRGLHFRDPGPGSPNRHPLVFSQGETDRNHCWFPTRDFPDDRASSEVRVRVARPYYAVSNGAPVALAEHPDGTRSFHYLESVPHPTYLISLACGVYEEIELPADPAAASRVPLLAYGYPGDGERVRYTLRGTGAMLALFERLTGVPYPFERYAQVFVTRFLYSGMENVGATTLTDWTLHRPQDEPHYDSQGLVSHEAAHQWFGNWITCRNWAHTWLNEGFATFLTGLWYEASRGPDEAAGERMERLDSYLRAAKRERRALVIHDFPPDSPPFDAPHAYNKGALVLHLLRAELGDSLFFRGLRRYASDAGGRSVETTDFRRAMEEATGRDLGLYFRQWVESPGHPEVGAGWSWDEKARAVEVVIEQTQAADGRTPVFDFPLEAEFAFPAAGGTPRFERRRFDVTGARCLFRVAAGESPLWGAFDPEFRLPGTIDHRAGARELRRILAEAEPAGARVRAARELAQAGPGEEEIAALAGACAADPFWRVRAEAAEALAATPGPRGREALRDALERDEDPRVRSSAAGALAKHPEGDTPAVLARAMRADASETVRSAAAQALGAVARAHRFAGAESGRDRYDPERAYRDLKSLLAVSSHRDTVRAGALIGLCELRDPRVIDDALAATGAEGGDHLRLAAVSALGKAAGAFTPEEEPVRRERAYQRLRSLLADPFFRVRQRAIAALGELGDARALPEIEAAAAREREADFRGAAREAREQIASRGTRGAKPAESVEERMERLERENALLRERLDRLEAGGPPPREE